VPCRWFLLPCLDLEFHKGRDDELAISEVGDQFVRKDCPLEEQPVLPRRLIAIPFIIAIVSSVPVPPLPPNNLLLGFGTGDLVESSLVLSH